MAKKAETENINDKFHLRRQITLLFLLVIVSSTFVINFLSNKMIIKEFNEIAKKSGTENMNLIINILNIEIERLEFAAKDYGAWDNTYDFVEDRNEDYLESNYVDETFENNKWNMFFLLGRDNSVIYSKGYDFYEQEEVIIAEDFVKFLKNQAYLFDEEVKESAIVDTPNGKVMGMGQAEDG
jgi:sensor domain CHASE-containing protein